MRKPRYDFWRKPTEYDAWRALARRALNAVHGPQPTRYPWDQSEPTDLVALLAEAEPYIVRDLWGRLTPEPAWEDAWHYSPSTRTLADDLRSLAKVRREIDADPSTHLPRICWAGCKCTSTSKDWTKPEPNTLKHNIRG